MNRDLLKENRIHGNVMFPLEIYEQNMNGNGIILDCHWHDELELLFVTEGKAKFQLETSYYEVHAGQALFINSGEIHAGYPLNNSPCNFCAVVFHHNLLFSNAFDAVQSKYIEPLLKRQYSYPCHILGQEPWQHKILSQLALLIEQCQLKPFAYELFAKGLLYTILSLIISNSTLQLSSDSLAGTTYKTTRLKKVLNYIQMNYSRRITISELAILINMSEGHFCRFFKSMVHKTPIEYINYYRITKASSLLQDTSKKVLEIAIETGFDNLSYFIITFKSHMNCTPNQYRKQIISGN